MISRKSTVLIQRLYETSFCKTTGGLRRLDKDGLYYFLYEDDHEGWFLDILKRRVNVATDLRSFILNLHTGMAYTSKTQNIAQRRERGQILLRHLAISILKMLGQCEHLGIVNKGDAEMIMSRMLVNRLELDGYKYKNGKLFPIESTVIPEAEEQGYLEALIKELNLPDQAIIKHHLGLSEEHYVSDKWDDSISNSRKVLDAVLTQVASLVYLKVNHKTIPQAMLKNATDIRNFLEKQNLVTKIEREALDKNYGALSATGGHPYIAEKDQARLMRHVALTFSQFALLRYQGFLEKNP